MSFYQYLAFLYVYRPEFLYSHRPSHFQTESDKFSFKNMRIFWGTELVLSRYQIKLWKHQVCGCITKLGRSHLTRIPVCFVHCFYKQVFLLSYV